jgi:hypothetical protein
MKSFLRKYPKMVEKIKIFHVLDEILMKFYFKCHDLVELTENNPLCVKIYVFYEPLFCFLLLSKYLFIKILINLIILHFILSKSVFFYFTTLIFDNTMGKKL